MSDFKDYKEFAKEPLRLPINGTVYEVPEIDAARGLKLTGALDGTDSALLEEPGKELFQLVLGPLWDQLIADAVPLSALSRVGLTALADFQYGREVAEVAWETGMDPEALAAYTAALADSTSTDEATSTKRPASTNGTRTSRKN